LFDGKWRYDGTFNFGPSFSNTARAHQIESGLYNGCGVSTSRSEERAIFFATSGHKSEGYVYVIDETLLAATNISVLEFNDPLHPDQKEVTLIEASGKELPLSIVVEKYEVNHEGERTEGNRAKRVRNGSLTTYTGYLM
jgi:hypothetical protein